MKKISLILFLICLAAYSNAQNSETLTHPIDKKCEACLAKNTEKTNDMMQCFADARDSWQKEMEKHYALLLNILKGEKKEKLLMSQGSWATYKEKELELLGTLYYDKDAGKEKHIDAVSRQAELFKQRACTLQIYYDSLSEK